MQGRKKVGALSRAHKHIVALEELSTGAGILVMLKLFPVPETSICSFILRLIAATRIRVSVSHRALHEHTHSALPTLGLTKNQHTAASEFRIVTNTTPCSSVLAIQSTHHS